MEFFPAIGAERLPTGVARAAPDAQPKTGIAADFQTFLKLLTTQLRNQDPLKPLDATSFAEQLATFSGVEQQVKTNEMLAEIKGLLTLDGAGGLGAWVGREVSASRNVHFDGAQLKLEIPAATAEGERVLVVRDAAGLEVSREPIDAEGGTRAWPVPAESGGPRLPGLYSFEIERNGARESDPAMKPTVPGVVREARLEQGRVMLVFDGGATIAAEDVRAVRAGGT